MKTHSITPSALVALLVTCLGQASGFPQALTLSGTSYLQDFNSISSGLPNGWSVRTGATTSVPGTEAAFVTAATSWGIAGQFSNMASVTNNDGMTFTGSEDVATQAASTNRAPGLRLVSSMDPGAAFVLRIQDTLGFGGFQLNLDLMMLTFFSRTNLWTIDYAIGNSPVSFTALGTFTDLTAFGTNVFGGTNRTFSLPNNANDQSENLWIRVAILTASGPTGARDSFGIDNVSLSWTNVPPSTNKPAITDQPQSRTNNASTLATFTVDASGAGPLDYQWRKNEAPLMDGGNISGATSPTLVISNVLAADADGYSVLITNNFGSVTSVVATLTVVDPAIIASPASQTNVAGDNVLFIVTAAGTPPMTFQWKRDGSDLPGAAGEFLTTLTNHTLAITNVQVANQGAYSLVLSNSSGFVTSAVANINLLATPFTLIARWSFNSAPSDDDATTGVDTPSTGAGTGTFLPGNIPTFLNGSSSDPASLGLDNSGWNIKGYPLQGDTNLNKMGGVQFTVSTVGFQDILLTWEQQNNSRASRYSRLQYSTDGVNFIDHNVIDMGGKQGAFVLLSGSLSAISGANNNPSFAFRIVAEFESTAIGTTNDNYVATDPTQSYGSTAAAIRFDMVNVFGNTLGAAVPTITQIAIVGANVRIDFTAGAGDSPGDFTLYSSGTVDGTYGGVASTISQLGPGVFRSERLLALDGLQQFYRIRR